MPANPLDGLDWKYRFYAAYHSIVACERRLERAGVKPRPHVALATPLEELSWEQRFVVAFHALLTMQVREAVAREEEKTAAAARRFLMEGQPKRMGRLYPSHPGIRILRPVADLHARKAYDRERRLRSA